MALIGILLGFVLLTSFISGVLGMAGGMILMGVFAWLLPVPVAMVLHGVTQMASNGSRAWFLREHIQYQILGWYVIGAVVALGGFFALAIVPTTAVVLILVGLTPWISLAMPKELRLDVTRPATAVSCGVVVTIAQLLAGASGPALDVFYQDSKLNRHEVVASKAITQTLGHLTKLIYYVPLLIVGATAETGADLVPWWVYVAVIVVATAGTRLGKTLLDRLSEDLFRNLSRYVILAIGTVCIARGAWVL